MKAGSLYSRSFERGRRHELDLELYPASMAAYRGGIVNRGPCSSRGPCLSSRESGRSKDDGPLSGRAGGLATLSRCLCHNGHGFWIRTAWEHADPANTVLLHGRERTRTTQISRLLCAGGDRANCPLRSPWHTGYLLTKRLD